MKRGIEVTWSCDRHGIPVLTIAKKRGKLTLAEIEDILRYENNQQFCGRYAILLNCTETTVGGNGMWGMENEDKGDAVDLYPIEEGENCPVCGKFTPPYDYCPNCGTAWKDMDRNVETLLASMREETARNIGAASNEGGKLAWYWTYIGALDMAMQLGMITEQRRQELYKEVEDLKPGIKN